MVVNGVYDNKQLVFPTPSKAQLANRWFFVRQKYGLATAVLRNLQIINL